MSFGGEGVPSRNMRCSCGSGKRFKNCCGRPGIAVNDHPEISDKALFEALILADGENLLKGLKPSARDLMNVPAALSSFGIQAILMGQDTSPIVLRANRLNKQLFREKDF